MTQETANKIFSTSLEKQLTELFTTSDDMAFIRYEEAVRHSEGLLIKDTKPLQNKTIEHWFPIN